MKCGLVSLEEAEPITELMPKIAAVLATAITLGTTVNRIQKNSCPTFIWLFYMLFIKYICKKSIFSSAHGSYICICKGSDRQNSSCMLDHSFHCWAWFGNTTSPGFMKLIFLAGSGMIFYWLSSVVPFKRQPKSLIWITLFRTNKWKTLDTSVLNLCLETRMLQMFQSMLQPLFIGCRDVTVTVIGWIGTTLTVTSY